ncbi:hypothetical protein B0H63DRAFT_529892 [Podospora didyma]|uniref:DUF221-domain-containing protein n=1 Tax=Podospora didyma TaxID=330526 RepID=A0AAE0N1Z8_9PEZI|nr:hypothetical protein B0H63DRAFT_529892 [Podospora didyma]
MDQSLFSTAAEIMPEEERENVNYSPASLSGMVSTLVPTAVLSSVLFIIFLFLRRTHRQFYAPRTYNKRLQKRPPALPDGLLNWFREFWHIPDVHVLQHQSLDAYLFLRYLRVLVIICLVGCCITWPVLFPVNATGGGGKEQLDILTYGNIGPDQKHRYYAHVFICWAYLSFVMYLIMCECIFYVYLRQAYLLSPSIADADESRVVMFTSVPAPFQEEKALRAIFEQWEIVRISLPKDTTELDKLVKERDKAVDRLEAAIVKASKPKRGPVATTAAADEHVVRLYKDVAKLDGKIQEGRMNYENNPKKLPAAFIEFETQEGATSAAQCLAVNDVLSMTDIHAGIRPDEVNWKALAIYAWERVIRRYAAYAFVATMILFWSVPVAVVGAISNVTYLRTLPFLAWLDEIPATIMGVVTGLLPALALSVLMSIVPPVMRLCAKFAGEPTRSTVELFTQNANFAFQVVQVFLVTAVSSSASAVAKQIIEKPSSVTTILAGSLPSSSNFYISYFIIQGLGIATGVLTQLPGFLFFSLSLKYFCVTPRAISTRWYRLNIIQWGSIVPVYTTIVVIAITYACISPLMLGWATIGTELFYLAWRYNVFFMADTQIDTRGLIYPRAIKQLFVGIYLSELCMIGMFGASVAPGPMVLMVAYLFFTVLFHISLNRALSPLFSHVPLSLFAEERKNRSDPEVAIMSATSGDEAAHAVDTLPEGLLKTLGLSIRTLLVPWQYLNYRNLRDFFDTVVYDQNGGAGIERDLVYHPPSATARKSIIFTATDPHSRTRLQNVVEILGGVVDVGKTVLCIKALPGYGVDQTGVVKPIDKDQPQYVPALPESTSVENPSSQPRQPLTRTL